MHRLSSGWRLIWNDVWTECRLKFLSSTELEFSLTDIVEFELGLRMVGMEMMPTKGTKNISPKGGVCVISSFRGCRLLDRPKVAAPRSNCSSAGLGSFR
jgi:hypothetical protein